MAGIPTESPLVLRESLGSSHNRLTSAEDYQEALLSGYPPVGLLDTKNVYHAEQKGNRLPRPERRGLRSPWGQVARRETLSDRSTDWRFRCPWNRRSGRQGIIFCRASNRQLGCAPCSEKTGRRPW